MECLFFQSKIDNILCGSDKQEVNSIPLSQCTKDIFSHCQTFCKSFVDSGSEKEIILAKGGVFDDVDIDNTCICPMHRAFFRDILAAKYKKVPTVP